MKTLSALITALLLTALTGCLPRLGLDIMNAGSTEIRVESEAAAQDVAPGMSFHAVYPPPDRNRLYVSSQTCRHEYALPDLHTAPWKYLIGKSVKFRWFDDGLLVAYPPTPDVRIAGNPERASSEDRRTIEPIRTTCD